MSDFSNAWQNCSVDATNYLWQMNAQNHEKCLKKKKKEFGLQKFKLYLKYFLLIFSFLVSIFTFFLDFLKKYLALNFRAKTYIFDFFITQPIVSVHIIAFDGNNWCVDTFGQIIRLNTSMIHVGYNPVCQSTYQ